MKKIEAVIKTSQETQKIKTALLQAGAIQVVIIPMDFPLTKVEVVVSNQGDKRAIDVFEEGVKAGDIDQVDLWVLRVGDQISLRCFQR